MADVKKSLSVTDQSIQTDTNVIILERIIPPGTDIDNNEIYDTRTGETIRRIDECIAQDSTPQV